MCAYAVALQRKLSDPYLFRYDEGAYLSSARLVMAEYPLFSSVFSSQPPLFLETLGLAFRIFGDNVTVGRELMVLSSLVSLSAVAWISWRLAGPLAVPVAMLSLGLPQVFFDQSQSVQAEMPALAFALVAIAVLLPVTGQWSSKRIVLGGTLFGIGLLYKLLIAPMLLSILFLLTVAPLSEHVKKWHLPTAGFSSTISILRRLLLFGLASAATCILVLSRYDFSSAYEQFINFQLVQGDYYGARYHTNLQRIDKIFRPELGFLILAVAGLAILFVKNRLAASWICVWILATGLFLVNRAPLSDHHLVLLLPPIAVSAAASVLYITTFWHKPWGKLLILIPLLSLIYYDPNAGLVWTIERDLTNVRGDRDRSQEPEVVRSIQEYTSPDDFVVSDQPMQTFNAGRLSSPWLADPCDCRIDTGYLTEDQAINSSKDAHVVVFWEGSLESLPKYTQWVHLNFQLVKEFKSSRQGEIREIYVRKSAGTLATNNRE